MPSASPSVLRGAHLVAGSEWRKLSLLPRELSVAGRRRIFSADASRRCSWLFPERTARMLRSLLLVALVAAVFGADAAPDGWHARIRASAFWSRGQPAFAPTALPRLPVVKGATCGVRLAMSAGTVSEGGNDAEKGGFTRSAKFECIRECINMLRGGAGPREYAECVESCRLL